MNVWKNKKTGNLYEVLNDDVHDATNGHAVLGELHYVLYRGIDGRAHVRERDEFHEKFEKTDLHSMYLSRGESVGDTKMVIVVHTDLKMPVGKIAAQAAHAALAAILQKGEWTDEGKYLLNNLTQADSAWLRYKFTKIALACDSMEEMNALEVKAKEAGLNVRMIIDAGDTVFNGVPTPTCLAIGPDWPSRVNAVTGHLKLLR